MRLQTQFLNPNCQKELTELLWNRVQYLDQQFLNLSENQREVFKMLIFISGPFTKDSNFSLR